MTAFKAGQTVRAIRATKSAYGHTFTQGARVVVMRPRTTSVRRTHPNHTLGVSPVASAEKHPDEYDWQVNPDDFELVEKVVPTTGGPFDAGDSVRFVAQGAGAYGRAGMVYGRVFTVREGTNVERGVIGLEGMRGMWPAKKFELVAKAKPKPAGAPPAAVHTDMLASTIWMASRNDEGTISATGADHVAAAVRNLFVVIEPSKVDVDKLAPLARAAWIHTNGPGLWSTVVRAVLAELGIEAES